jgi:CRP-like cAMP-binding protein
VTQTSVICIDGAALRKQIEGNIRLALAMLTGISANLKSLVTTVSELKNLSAAQRLGLFLLTFSENDTGQVILTLPYEKRILAEKLGMKAETLSRAFQKIKAQNINLVQSGRVIQIDQIEKLARFCEVEI